MRLRGGSQRQVYRCGDLGHRAGACKAKKPRCLLCADLGRLVGHYLGDRPVRPPSLRQEVGSRESGDSLPLRDREVVPGTLPASQSASVAISSGGVSLIKVVEEPPMPIATPEEQPAANIGSRRALILGAHCAGQNGGGNGQEEDGSGY